MMKRLSKADTDQEETKRFLSHSFDIKLKGTPKTWMQNLSDAGFSSIIIENDRLILHHVQSTDSNTDPNDKIKIVLKKDGLDLSCQFSKDTNKIKKRLEATHLCLLTLSASQAQNPPPQLSSFLADSFDQAIDYVSTDLNQLSADNQNLKSRIAELEKKIKDLTKSSDEDSARLIEKTQQISRLQTRLSQLTEVSDNQLDDELIEWLITHEGKIDITQFSKIKDIPYTRIEQSLDRLCTTNRIERIR